MDGNEMRKMKLEEKMNEAKSKGKELVEKGWKALNAGLDWVIKNPDKAALIGTGLAVAKKWKCDRNERTYEDKRSEFWDGRNMWKLKRPMNMREQLQLRRRLDEGEQAYDILDDLGLLKKW